MSSFGDAIQEKCFEFGDRVIKQNDYLKKPPMQNDPSRWLTVNEFMNTMSFLFSSSL